MDGGDLTVFGTVIGGVIGAVIAIERIIARYLPSKVSQGGENRCAIAHGDSAKRLIRIGEQNDLLAQELRLAAESRERSTRIMERMEERQDEIRGDVRDMRRDVERIQATVEKAIIS